MKIIAISFLIVLGALPAHAAAGVRINGDITLVKDTIDPYRVFYFSDGSSQQFANPWSFNSFSSGSIFYNAIGGKVGIGTSTPTTELEVSGTVKATALQGDGTGMTNVTAVAMADNSVTSNSISGKIAPEKLDLSGVQSKYGRVKVVAISGGDYNNPATAMAEYAAWCPGLSATTPCLLKIMPGVYTVGTPVVMQPYIDIEGSGEKVTKITSTINSASANPPDIATVKGASNAGLRFLTVENTGTGFYTVAILNNFVSPQLTHVTASASAGYYSYGIYNSSSSPVMIDVIVTGLGGLGSYGIYNSSSSPTMTNLTVTASGGMETNTGVTNNLFSSPAMTNVTINAAGGAFHNDGVYNSDSSSPVMTNILATASGGSSRNCGIYNRNSSSPVMTNVTATGSVGLFNYGVYNVSSSPVLTSVTATASDGAESYGVYSEGSGAAVKINHSVIKGAINTIYNGSGVTTRIGNTQLDGGAVYNLGTLTCAGVYDENYIFYASTCP